MRELFNHLGVDRDVLPANLGARYRAAATSRRMTNCQGSVTSSEPLRRFFRGASGLADSPAVKVGREVFAKPAHIVTQRACQFLL